MPGPQPCHYRPFIFYIVGRGLDPYANFRRRSPPRGVGDAAPYSGNPQGFSLPLTSPAAWGQAALHPTLSQFAGRGASPRRNSDGNAYVAYTKDSNEAGTYSEVSKTNKLDAGFTANANSTLNGKTGNEA